MGEDRAGKHGIDAKSARMNMPTNTIYVARQRYALTLLDLMRAPSRATELKIARREDYCNHEVERARSGGRPGDVISAGL
jgi:hypothetical protein